MQDIKELIRNVEKYKDTVIQKKFLSKKNSVCYAIYNNRPVVLKWYAPGFKTNINTEYQILRNSPSSINVPTAFDIDEQNNVILMGYIPGTNLCDVINDERLSANKKKYHIISLASWFHKFHHYFKKEDKFRIRGDSILRNFILTDRIWGVDFEESRFGFPQEDVADICSSILSSFPMFTNEKFLLCKYFINSYKEYATWDILNIEKEIAYSLLKKIQFRPEDEFILRKYSNKIRQRGI